MLETFSVKKSPIPCRSSSSACPPALNLLSATSLRSQGGLVSHAELPAPQLNRANGAETISAKHTATLKLICSTLKPQSRQAERKPIRLSCYIWNQIKNTAICCCCCIHCRYCSSSVLLRFGFSPKSFSDALPLDFGCKCSDSRMNKKQTPNYFQNKLCMCGK